MGLLSSTVSVTQYHVEGDLKEPVLETVCKGLEKNSIREIDDEASEKITGWTSFENPFQPDFEGSSFVLGTYMIFSLRVDKKTIPPKIIKKKCMMEMEKRLAATGREFLSRNEKREIRDHVIQTLSMRIPATPNIFDLIWNYEESWVWFFSTLKSANEELETLFSKSFKLRLIRLFPYTIGDLTAGLSGHERDVMNNLSPTKFTG